MISDGPRQWKLQLFRGILAVVFGFLALLWPALTLAVLVGLFAAYALLDGIAALSMAIRARPRRGRWGLWLEGFLGIGAAVVALLYPGMTAVALLVVIAVWAIISGITSIVAAIVLEREIEGAAILPVFGMLSLLLGLALLVQPFAGALALAWMIGIYALVSGTMYIMLALRTRRTAGLAHV